jgi:hypothetical protein
MAVRRRPASLPATEQARGSEGALGIVLEHRVQQLEVSNVPLD